MTYSPHWFLAESDLPSRTAAGPSGTFGQIRKMCLFLSAMAPGQGQVSRQVGPGQSFSSTCLLGCCITGPPVHEETCWPGVNTLFPVPPYLPYQWPYRSQVIGSVSELEFILITQLILQQLCSTRLFGTPGSVLGTVDWWAGKEAWPQMECEWVWVSCCCCNKLLQICWLKTA